MVDSWLWLQESVSPFDWAERCFNWRSVWKVSTHTHTHTLLMHAHSTTTKEPTILLTVSQCIVFSRLPKVAIPMCPLPRSFTQHSRDSLIKEQHYLSAAALLAVRNARFSVLRQERKESMPPTLAAAYPRRAYGPRSLNSFKWSDCQTSCHMRELQWCFTTPSFSKMSHDIAPA